MQSCWLHEPIVWLLIHSGISSVFSSGGTELPRSNEGDLPSQDFYLHLPKWKEEHYISNEKISAIGQMKKQLQNLMTTKVGIFKTTSGLLEAEMELKGILSKHKTFTSK